MTQYTENSTNSKREVSAALAELNRTACYLDEAALLLNEKWLSELRAESSPHLFEALVDTLRSAAGKQLDAVDTIMGSLDIRPDWDDLEGNSIFHHEGGSFSKANRAALAGGES